MDARKSKRQRMFHPHARLIIFNVLRYMAREAELNDNLISLQKVEERVAMATGISRRTLSRIKKEYKDNEASPFKDKDEKTSNSDSKDPKTSEDSNQSGSKNVSTCALSLPRIIIDSDDNGDSDDDVILSSQVKSEMDSENDGMPKAKYLKTEESDSDNDGMYYSQSVMLPELMNKSEDDSDDSDSD